LLLIAGSISRDAQSGRGRRIIPGGNQNAEMGVHISSHRADRRPVRIYRDRSAAAGIAKFLFFPFLVVCLIFFIIGISIGKKVM
jgi:hypothetical protein